MTACDVPRFVVTYVAEAGVGSVGSDDRVVAEAEEKFRRLLEGIESPWQLSQYLRPIKGLSSGRKHSGPSAIWRVWKGELGPGKSAGGGAVRFILELERLSASELRLIARYRGGHDGYDEYLDRVRAGKVGSLVAVEAPSLPAPLPQRKLHMARAPWFATESSTPVIGESPGVPPTLRRQDVSHALRAGSQHSVHVDGLAVQISPRGHGLLISVEGAPDGVSRAYPTSAVESSEAWRIIRDRAARPELDPCVLPSEVEQQIFKEFIGSGCLPALLRGSAGSGKTTILTRTLASLLESSRVSTSAPPLYVTYSARLRDAARDRVADLLVIWFGWRWREAFAAADRSCKTVEELIDSVVDVHLGPRPDELRDGGWGHFSRWWAAEHSSQSPRAGVSVAADVWAVLNIGVLGFESLDAAPKIGEVRGRLSRRGQDFDAGLVEHAIEVWNKYRPVVREIGTADRGRTAADRTKEAFKYAANDPMTHAVWGHILCDEVQDLTDHDIIFLASISGSTLGRNGDTLGRWADGSLPLIFAGDELQSVRHSGFTFEGCAALLQEVCGDLGYFLDLPTPRTLNGNYRSLKVVAELGVAVRRVIESTRRGRTIDDPLIHRPEPPSGVVELVDRSEPLDPSVASIFSRQDVAVLVPCREGEKEKYCSDNGALRTIVGPEVDVDARFLLTPEQCKGSEYPAVVLCGFGSAYEEAKKSGRLNWFLNALSVASTRARDRVIFLDSHAASKGLLETLCRDGKMESHPTPVNRLDFTAEERFSTLHARLLSKVREGEEAAPDEIWTLINAIEESLGSVETSGLAPRARQAVGATRAWLAYREQEAVPRWDELEALDGGLLWDRCLDLAIERRDTEALDLAFEREPRRSGNRANSKLLTAALICALDGEGDPARRVQTLLGRLNLDALEEGGSVASMVTAAAMSDQWKQVCLLVLDTQSEDSTPERDEHRRVWAECLETLDMIDGGEVLAAYIQIRLVLPDLVEAEKLIREWESKLETFDGEQVLEELLVQSDLWWFDRDARLDFREALRASDSSFDRAIVTALQTESARRSAREHLGELLNSLRGVKVGEVASRPRAEQIAAYMVQSLISTEVRQLLDGLQSVDSAVEQNKGDSDGR